MRSHFLCPEDHWNFNLSYIALLLKDWRCFGILVPHPWWGGPPHTPLTFPPFKKKFNTSGWFYALFHGWKFVHQMPSHSQEITALPIELSRFPDSLWVFYTIFSDQLIKYDCLGFIHKLCICHFPSWSKLPDANWNIILPIFSENRKLLMGNLQSSEIEYTLSSHYPGGPFACFISICVLFVCYAIWRVKGVRIKDWFCNDWWLWRYHDCSFVLYKTSDPFSWHGLSPISIGQCHEYNGTW
jgi:hypothetical protein